MDLVRVKIAKLLYSQFRNGAYTLILKNEDDSIRLPIVIGAPEAQAIAIVLEKMTTPRPLTHDLFKLFAKSFNIRIQKVVINKFEEGVFFSELHTIDSDGNEKIIDSRTSDAVALSLRFKCHIFTTTEILQNLGIEVKDKEESVDIPIEEDNNELDMMDMERLDELLKKAIEQEDYEYASKIRDEIEKRESS